MQYYIDATPLVNPAIHWASVALTKHVPPEQRLPIARTGFASAKAVPPDFFAPVTGPSAPTSAPRTQVDTFAELTQTLSESSVTAGTSDSEAQLNVEVDRIAKQRVQLLAAKYASGKESSEIVARLEILNRRLLDRAPRVSVDQVRALENANEQLAHIRAAREERSKRLGISV